MNDGDWICSDANCGNINFARRLSCYRCNKERSDGVKAFKKKLGTEIGKSAAEKSRGLFNADDWQCSKCANVNWARRTTCNVCNAPKFGEVEARTGYGGGYNERGVVEYRRRESSSDDEYDEFGRKKRKRKSDSQDEKVGTTEGPVLKMLPPTVLQKGNIMPERIPVAATKDKEYPFQHPKEKISGSLSDGSVCEGPILSKAAFRKYQLQSQTNYHRQDHMLPFYRSTPSRKRYASTGERDHTASSGYETGSKQGKRDSSGSPGLTACNPVMENRVSSTKNDVLYKFTGSTPADDFEVKYTIEERVRTAAYAIFYNNCKLTAAKFETFFDKPAPDFKTIFAWRQRLISTGCLNDTHTLSQNCTEKSNHFQTSVSNKNLITLQKFQKAPNPEEILISMSDSNDDSDSSEKAQNQPAPRQRSASIETLCLGRKTTAASSMSSDDGKGSRARSNSRSSRSSSRSSQNSDYPSDDSDKLDSNTKSSKKASSSKRHTNDSDSESVTYDSEEDDFRERVFKGSKTKRRKKKRVATVMPVKASNYETATTPAFQGYNTLKQLEQSPLATGKIYAPNLRNMTVKAKETHMDTDGCSSEYVPTRIGSTAKRNYQAFKDNVKRKGFWVKANGQSLSDKKIKYGTSMNAPAQKAAHTVNFWAKTHTQVNKYGTPKTLSNNSICGISATDTSIDDQSSKEPQTVITQDFNSKRYKSAVSDNSFWAKTVSISNDATKNAIPIFSPIKEMPSTDNYDRNCKTYKFLEDNSFWAKTSAKSDNSRTNTTPVFSPVEEMPNINANSNENCGYNSAPSADFAEDDFNEFVPVDPYSSVNNSIAESKSEDTSSIFDIVQSNTSNKNKSIMDIFGNGQSQDSCEKETELNKYELIRKRYETEWDDDDEALYKESKPTDLPTKDNCPLKAVEPHRLSSPMSNMLYGEDHANAGSSTLKVPVDVRERQDNLLDLLKNFQTKSDKDVTEKSQEHIPEHCDFPQIDLQEIPLPEPCTYQKETLEDKPQPISMDTSEDILQFSKEDIREAIQIPPKRYISLSKKVCILESITIKPKDPDPQVVTSVSPERAEQPVVSSDVNIPKDIEQQVIASNMSMDKKVLHSSDATSATSSSQKIINTVEQLNEVSVTSSVTAPQIDLSNILANLNTNTLLLALQNLQQLQQPSEPVHNKQDQEQTAEDITANPVETINLTNDEDWENESNPEGSIERQLQRLDGNTGDTPFLSDIFDPGPVVIPPNVAKKLNLNLEIPSEENKESLPAHTNSNAPIIGNFKSFALPKPIMLNRLKLTVKVPDKTKKPPGEKKGIRKKIKPGASKEGAVGEGSGGEEDEEESGDEADLSKYDLCGSDDEQGTSKTDDKKEGESTKESGGDVGDKNGKAVSPDAKKNKRRSSSSSSTSSSSSSSSSTSKEEPQNKFDDFNLNSEREGSPRGRRSHTRSRSPRPRSAKSPIRRKSRDSRGSRDKEKSRERDRPRKERRYSREGKHYSRPRHR